MGSKAGEGLLVRFVLFSFLTWMWFTLTISIFTALGVCCAYGPFLHLYFHGHREVNMSQSSQLCLSVSIYDLVSCVLLNQKSKYVHQAFCSTAPPLWLCLPTVVCDSSCFCLCLWLCRLLSAVNGCVPESDLSLSLSLVCISNTSRYFYFCTMHVCINVCLQASTRTVSS